MEGRRKRRGIEGQRNRRRDMVEGGERRREWRDGRESENGKKRNEEREREIRMQGVSNVKDHGNGQEQKSKADNQNSS